MASVVTAISHLLRVELDERGWKLSDLAQMSGVSVGVLKHYSAGSREPAREALSRVVNALLLEGPVAQGLLHAAMTTSPDVVEPGTVVVDTVKMSGQVKRSQLESLKDWLETLDDLPRRSQLKKSLPRRSKALDGKTGIGVRRGTGGSHWLEILSSGEAFRRLPDDIFPRFAPRPKILFAEFAWDYPVAIDTLLFDRKWVRDVRVMRSLHGTTVYAGGAGGNGAVRIYERAERGDPPQTRVEVRVKKLGRGSSSNDVVEEILARVDNVLLWRAPDSRLTEGEYALARHASHTGWRRFEAILKAEGERHLLKRLRAARRKLIGCHSVMTPGAAGRRHQDASVLAVFDEWVNLQLPIG